jgi:hypothetical protein
VPGRNPIDIMANALGAMPSAVGESQPIRSHRQHKAVRPQLLSIASLDRRSFRGPVSGGRHEIFRVLTRTTKICFRYCRLAGVARRREQWAMK